MALLNAQQSVNTRDLPELEPIIGDIFNPTTMQGAYAHGPTGLSYRFGDDDIQLPGTYQFAGAQVIDGPIESITVSRSGSQAYKITDFDLRIEQLWADAQDGKLDTVPDNIFNGEDELNGSPFNDILFAFDLDDVINGGDGDDEMNGGDGDDDLTGGKGADSQTGGLGADTFFFLALSDSTKKASGRDSILDFHRAEDDLIDLSAIDAKKGKGNQEFKFIKKQDFHDKKGELRYKVKDGDAYVQGDVNGDGKADFAIVVEHVSKLKASDFDL